MDEQTMKFMWYKTKQYSIELTDVILIFVMV